MYASVAQAAAVLGVALVCWIPRSRWRRIADEGVVGESRGAHAHALSLSEQGVRRRAQPLLAVTSMSLTLASVASFSLSLAPLGWHAHVEEPVYLLDIADNQHAFATLLGLAVNSAPGH